MNHQILFVLTNHDKLGANDGESAGPTGFHLAEAAQPWQVLTQAGYTIDLASPRGGKAPIDPGSLELEDPVNRAFLDDDRVKSQIDNTNALADIDLTQYDAIYFPGGHGTMWDLPDDHSVQQAVADLYEAGKVIGAVCHGPAALVNVKLSSGEWLVNGKTVSVFTDEEEKAVEKEQIMPFLLASTLIERGAKHDKAANFKASVSVDDNLVTGQNPASARGVGEAIRDKLEARRQVA